MILSLLREAELSGAKLQHACGVVGVSLRTIQRWRIRPDGDDRRCGPRSDSPSALSAVERERALAVMREPQYAGLSPKQLVPRLADEGRYVASESTFYRLQRRYGMRKNLPSQRCTHITRASKVHSASGPNQVWSWDITWLPTTLRGRYFYLYLVMDVWSRRIVGWAVWEKESATLAATLIQRICEQSNIDPKGLVLHSDNGGPMRGSAMIATLQWLGIVPSFSRPHVSDDNPYSEALFRTLKYSPAYPNRPFTTVEQSRNWVERFVSWYNREHRHSGIRYVTPDQRHFGQEQALLAARRCVYEGARKKHPERWSGPIRDWTPIGTVELNPEPTCRAA